MQVIHLCPVVALVGFPCRTLESQGLLFWPIGSLSIFPRRRHSPRMYASAMWPPLPHEAQNPLNTAAL